MNAPNQALSRDYVYRRVAQLLHEIVGTPLEDINEDITVDEDLQMTSVIFVELHVAIEEELDTELDPIEVVELNRLGDIVDYMYERALETRR
ncbi:MAG TPA: acyl carrier protein [Terriglobales bacterium]|nr:acyl carrier protein [Terriglobales bacterium]